MAPEDHSETKLNLSSLNTLKAVLKLIAGVGEQNRSLFREIFIYLVLLVTIISDIEFMLKAYLEKFKNGDNIGTLIYLVHTTAKHIGFVFYRNLFHDFLNDMEQLEMSTQYKATQHLNNANTKARKLAITVTLTLAVELILGSASSLIMYIIDSSNKPIFMDKYSLLSPNTHPLIIWIVDNIEASLMLIISVSFCFTLFLSCEYSNVLVTYLSKEMNELRTRDKSDRLTLLKSNALLYTKILRFRRKQWSLLSGLSTLEISCTSLTICFFLYSVATMEFSPNSLMKVASLVSVSVLPYFICYAGQTMENKGSQLIEECYSCGWEQWTPNERKMLSVFLTGISKPTQFHYKLTFFMNIKAFGHILQGAWSYYAVLKRIAGESM